MTTFVDSYRFAAAGGGAATVDYVANYTSASDAATYTFTAADIGTADSDRTVVVAVASTRFANPATVISSVTVGGLSATELIQFNNTPGDTGVVGLYAIDIAAGTSADIIVTFSGSGSRCGIGVYRCTGISTTPNDTASTGASGGSESVAATTGGAVIGVAHVAANAGFTWSGLTEMYDARIASENGAHTGASLEVPSATTVSASWSGSTNTPATAYAAW